MSAKKPEARETRTPNLPLWRRTRYQLRHSPSGNILSSIISLVYFAVFQVMILAAASRKRMAISAIELGILTTGVNYQIILFPK